MKIIQQTLTQGADNIRRGSFLLREALHHSSAVEAIVLLDLIGQAHELETGVRQLQQAIESAQSEANDPAKP